MSAVPIRGKKIVVEKLWPRDVRFAPGRKYLAHYPGEGCAYGYTADEAREKVVRQLVLTGRYVDPRPVSKGGVR